MLTSQAAWSSQVASIACPFEATSTGRDLIATWRVYPVQIRGAHAARFCGNNGLLSARGSDDGVAAAATLLAHPCRQRCGGDHRQWRALPDGRFDCVAGFLADHLPQIEQHHRDQNRQNRQVVARFPDRAKQQVRHMNTGITRLARRKNWGRRRQPIQPPHSAMFNTPSTST